MLSISSFHFLSSKQLQETQYIIMEVSSWVSFMSLTLNATDPWTTLPIYIWMASCPEFSWLLLNKVLKHEAMCSSSGISIFCICSFFFALPTIFILEILFSFFLYVLIQFHLQRHFLRLWKTLNFVQFMGIVIMPIIVYFITESWWNIACFIDLIWLEWNKNLEACTHLKWMMVACLTPCHRGLPIHSEPARLILGTSQKKALVLQQINKN